MANWLKKNACYTVFVLLALLYVFVAHPSIGTTIVVAGAAGLAGGVLDLLRKK